jgi:hypothetical protein
MGVAMMDEVVMAVMLGLFRPLLRGVFFGEDSALESVGGLTGLGKLLVVCWSDTGREGGLLLVLAAFDLDLRKSLDVDVDAALVIRFRVVVHVMERNTGVRADRESGAVLGNRRALGVFGLLIFGGRGRAGRGRR